MRRFLAGIVGTGVLTAMVLALPARVQAQDPGGQAPPQGGMRGQFAGAQHVTGEVVSVSGANITVKNNDSLHCRQYKAIFNTYPKGLPEAIRNTWIKHSSSMCC